MTGWNNEKSFLLASSFYEVVLTLELDLIKQFKYEMVNKYLSVET